MSRPGMGIRAIAARLCRARTMERLVDPTLADLQAEYQNAVSRGRKWESRWTWILGHVALVRVVAVHGGMRAIRLLCDLRDQDRRMLLQAFAAGTVIMIVGTLLLAAVPFFDLVSINDPNSTKLALYLIPQALPLSIPVGLTFGILWGLGRVAIRGADDEGVEGSFPARTLLLLVAVISSVVSFAMLAWVVPASNQAFRVSIAGRPVSKGANELTLRELGQLLEPGTHEPLAVSAPSDIRSLALNYHTRWALASAPSVLAFFAIALTSGRKRGRIVLLLAGSLAILGYCLVMYTARGLGLNRTLSAFAAAWAPNAALLILSVAVMKLSSPRTEAIARG